MDIIIFTDSQAAIKSPESVNSFNSRTALNRRLSLNEMAEPPPPIWMPDHRNIPGNCLADELTRQGTTLSISLDMMNLGMPIATVKTLLKLFNH